MKGPGWDADAYLFESVVTVGAERLTVSQRVMRGGVAVMSFAEYVQNVLATAQRQRGVIANPDDVEVYVLDERTPLHEYVRITE